MKRFTDDARPRLRLALIWMAAIAGVVETVLVNVRHFGWWAGWASLVGYVAVAMLAICAVVVDYQRRERVLELLANGAWWVGLDLVEYADGLLSRHNVYGTLRRLEDDGLVESIEDPYIRPDELAARGGLPRRMYRRSAARRAP